MQVLERIEHKLVQQIRSFELKKLVLERKLGRRLREFDQETGFHVYDQVRFFRTWIEKPGPIGAILPSGKALAQAMARVVDPQIKGPIIELGPGTGPVTEALVARGVDAGRLVLVEFDDDFCRLLRGRYPAATIVQGDAYNLGRLLKEILPEPGGAVLSGLPLFTKPLSTRLRLLQEAFGLLAPGAPFVQFTYAAISPIPTSLKGIRAHGSEPIWANVPPARVWVYSRA
jgi:phosphatidylethanolamine/phosphatidyl-N-methylethanolamine N-methyltransferase